jgi:hypothetical protein
MGGGGTEVDRRGTLLVEGILVPVGTDDGRIVAVGETGTGLKPCIRVVGLAEEMMGFKSIDCGLRW